ncbi:hypothetical protein BC940DRAFT_300869 [Gongronella butleri]|nr:hypothetical protein BC940DRAFT_300869 [Gongronella butleri]
MKGRVWIFVRPFAMPKLVLRQTDQIDALFAIFFFKHDRDSAAYNPSSGADASSAMIITFEVVFSIVIFAVVAGCYCFGIQRRNRLRKAKMEQYDAMVERALTRQEAVVTRHLQRHPSSTSIDTFNSMFAPPPPPYGSEGNASTHRINEHDVHRLSQALLTTHLVRTTMPAHHGAGNDALWMGLPPYDSASCKEERQNEENDSRISAPSTPSLTTPPPAVTRPPPQSPTLSMFHGDDRSAIGRDGPSI